MLFRSAQNPGFRIVDGNWPDLKPLWEPSRTYWIWTHLSLFFRDKVYLFLYMAEKWIKQTWQAKRVEGSVFNDNLHCGSLLEVTRYAKASSLPLIFVVTPHGHGKQNRLYMGTSLRGGDFERMLNCVRNEKVEMIDLRKDLEGDLDWYWKND